MKTDLMEENNNIINIHERLIQNFVEKKRPPLEIREKVDIGYSFKNLVVEIFEIRPRWGNEKVKHNIPIAKAKFVKTIGAWKIYWMRGNGKWFHFKPEGEKGVYKDLNEVLNIIGQDAYGCFWG